MRRILSHTAAWIDNRTGIISGLGHFLSEEIPASAGWPHVLGSVALFLLLIQAFTGLLLAMNYAPTTGQAYVSLSYIIHRVTGGRLIHGLHHWGASMMIIVVCLHMAQVFIYGAFRKPRETTWIAGVTLLFLTLAFGLTGYLLPWDNRAYWGTMVTTRILEGLPLVGSTLTELIGATKGVGVITFTRFYALHTMVLPALAGLITTVHIYLVRRHGITPGKSDGREVQKFYPKQLFRDFCGVFLAFACLFLAAAFLEVPLEQMADPTDTTYVPRPEWYFLFLFQLLKVFPGELELIGTLILPTLAVGALLCLPFLKSDHRLLNGRLWPVLIVSVAFTVWAGLTAAAGWPPRSLGPKPHIPEDAAEWARMAPEEIAGLGYFRASSCDSCHDLLMGTPKPGPTLGSNGLQHPKDWILQHFTSNAKVETPLTTQQENALLVFVAKLRPESVRVVSDMSSTFVEGAQVYVANTCASCHKVNGIGGDIGPALNGLAIRHSETWVRAHFASPRKLSPGSIMPPYHFSEADEKKLIEYLFALPE